MKVRRIYSCVKCGGSVEKPPCVKPPEPEKDHKGHVKEVKFEYVGLHGWRCLGQCGGPTKVSVKLESVI